MSDNNKLFTDLAEFNHNKIWVTKKIRMDASEKMDKKNTRINYFLIYYSACLAIMSFLMLYAPKGFNLSLFASMISLILPSANIFQYKAEYSKKSEEYRNCYLELSDLENDINTYLASNNSITEDKSKEYKSKYDEILKKYINQTDMDYLMFSLKQIKRGNTDGFKLTKGNMIHIYSIKIFNFLMLILLISLPALLILKKVLTIDFVIP